MASKKIKNAYSNVASALGLSFCEDKMIISGLCGEYDFALQSADLSRTPYMLVLTTSVTNGAEITADEKKELRGSYKHIMNVLLNGNVLTVRFSNINLAKAENIEKIRQHVLAVETLLRAKGYVPCCGNCGQNVETCDYTVHGQVMQLCDFCAQDIASTITVEGAAVAAKKENYAAGIVGALIGALAGVACIVLLGQIGYVAALSGLVMAICVLKLYEKFAGKITTPGFIICIIVMLGMTFVGKKLDWAIAIYREIGKEFGINILECYRVIPAMIAEEVIDGVAFVMDMIYCYLFVIVGFVPTVVSSIKSRKAPAISKIGGPYTRSVSNYDWM